MIDLHIVRCVSDILSNSYMCKTRVNSDTGCWSPCMGRWRPDTRPYPRHTCLRSNLSYRHIRSRDHISLHLRRSYRGWHSRYRNGTRHKLKYIKVRQLYLNLYYSFKTRAPRGTDRSHEYNEHFCYKLDSRVKHLTTEWNEKQQHFITHAPRSLL